MANATTRVLLHHVRELAGREHAGRQSDAECLGRFAHCQDEAAFATLVRRHGPMVLGVCRRVLHDHHAAEDVFQATFLVLARKARSISKHGSVASWLHGVAHRLALKSKADAIRRQNHERCAGAGARSPDHAPTPPTDASWRAASPNGIAPRWCYATSKVGRATRPPASSAGRCGRWNAGWSKAASCCGRACCGAA